MSVEVFMGQGLMECYGRPVEVEGLFSDIVSKEFVTFSNSSFQLFQQKGDEDKSSRRIGK